METIGTRCCIAGGGPAGMMLGLLLARAGVEVVVLEKHGDFLRDFRGDTIHPSTLEVMHELGLLDELLALPHQKVPQLTAIVGNSPVTIADLSHVHARCRFIAFMPQWDFLDFLARCAARAATFRLRMQAEVTGPLEEAGRVIGVRAVTPQGPLEVHAALVVAADGRSSVLRAAAGLPARDLGAPMDVLWFRLSRRRGDHDETLGRIVPGRMLVTINRGEHWQCGYVIRKGGIDEIRRQGLASLRADVARLMPALSDRVSEVRDWDDVKLLTVQVDRLTRWYRHGLLCLGDAAHAMSPVGGVGINLAIQDAVAAANILVPGLRAGAVSTGHLRRVQRRRQPPTRITQWLQLQIQRRVIAAVLSRRVPLRPPMVVRLLQRFPFLRRIPGRLVGIGIRPEHVARHVRYPTKSAAFSP